MKSLIALLLATTLAGCATNNPVSRGIDNVTIPAMEAVSDVFAAIAKKSNPTPQNTLEEQEMAKKGYRRLASPRLLKGKEPSLQDAADTALEIQDNLCAEIMKTDNAVLKCYASNGTKPKSCSFEDSGSADCKPRTSTAFELNITTTQEGARKCKYYSDLLNKVANKHHQRWRGEAANGWASGDYKENSVANMFRDAYSKVYGGQVIITTPFSNYAAIARCPY